MKLKFHINAFKHSLYMGNEGANPDGHPILYLLFYKSGRKMEDIPSMM
jgi:hypothetical protein